MCNDIWLLWPPCGKNSAALPCPHLCDDGKDDVLGDNHQQNDRHPEHKHYKRLQYRQYSNGMPSPCRPMR